MSTINLSAYPYYDDFDEAKGYHKVLFHPSKPVQARELTQIQSILQNQLKHQADHLFKNGTMVIPGNVYYDNTVKFVKLTESYNGINSDDYTASLIGQTIRGTVSGVKAIVVHADVATSTDPSTIYVKYTEGNGSVHEFVVTDEIVCDELDGLTLSPLQVSTFTGDAAIFTVSEGVFYINSFFVAIPKQSITLSKYTATPTVTVGLNYTESVITENEDDTLYDNAFGFSNYGAPGAHRLKIDLTLGVKAYSYENDTDNLAYIELMKVKAGNIQLLNNATQYSEIEKLLARRTYDESGDYVVRDFGYTLKEYRNNNRKAWTAVTPYLSGDVVTNGGRYYVAQNTGFSTNTAPSHTYGTVSDGVIRWLEVTTPRLNSGTNAATGGDIETHQADEAKFICTVSPGKAYIQGFEVNKQQQTNVVINKARATKQVNNAQVYAPVGSYALVNTVTGHIDTSTMQAVSLLAPDHTTELGTAWATTMEFVSGTPGDAAAIYKLYLFDIKMNAGYDFEDDVLYVASKGSAVFDAKFSQVNRLITGLVSTATGSNVVTGKGTLFTQELRAGDQIQVAGENHVVSAIVNDAKLTVTTNFAATNTDATGILLIVELHSAGSYIVKMAHPQIAMLRDVNGLIDTEYTVQKTIAFTASAASHVLSIGVANETFEPSGHIVVATGSMAIINATYSLNIDATQLTIGGLSPSTSYKIIAIVKRVSSAAKEKVKSLQTKTVIIKATGVYADDDTTLISNSWNLSSAQIGLTECDATRIISATLSGSTGAYNATGETDVRSWFHFNNGVTESYYGISKLIRNSGITIPTKSIKVTFEFFDHSIGDYFSADSYTLVSLDNIPQVTINGENVSLKDCLDFRSRVSDDGLSFSGTGGNVSTPLYSGSTISTSYSYYMPRKDNISLTAAGEFEYFEGTASDTPFAPSVSDGSLVLAEFFVPAYTNRPKDVGVTTTSYRRYTMADVGKLDNRLSNVEQYVALSELEKATTSMQILDANGLDRYKNGFIVDPFTDYNVADSESSDFSATIDTVDNFLTSRKHAESVQLLEAAGTTRAARISAHYAVTGDYYSLPYTSQPLIQQLMATRSEFINPFAVFSWNGNLAITPKRDAWIENRININSSDVFTQSIANITNVVNTFNVVNNTVATTTAARWNWNWAGDNGRAWGWGWGWNRRWWGWQPRTTSSTVSSTATNTTSATTSSSVTTVSTTSTDTMLSELEAPYMRSVPLALEATGMKPFTSINTYFDSDIVNEWTYSAYKLVISGEVGKFFDYRTASSGNVNVLERQTWSSDTFAGGQHSNFFDKGEIIRSSSTTKSTAVVLGREVEINPSTGATQTVLYVILPRTFTASNTLDGSNITVNGYAQNASAFTVGQTVTGQDSGATATVVSFGAGSLTTNSNGSWYGTLRLPSFRYASGEHVVTITDSTTSDTSLAQTSAIDVFTSLGKLQDTQRDIVNTYNTVTTNVTTVTNATTQTNTTTNATTYYQWWRWNEDPLAQSFNIPIEHKDGVYVTSVDLYFAVKATTESKPVYVQIVEMINGTPSRNVIGGAQAMVQAADIVASTTGTVATNFKFPNLIYLANGREYAVKVLTDSTAYKVWIAQMGETLIDNPLVSVAQQPHLGVLFKSQNNSTWTAEQMQDLKFQLNYAQFDISRTGSLNLYNRGTLAALDYMPINPFFYTNGSTTVKVKHFAHGLRAGMYVTYAGADTTATAMNATYTVTRVINHNEYTVTLAAAAAATGHVGGSAVTVQNNIKYDSVMLDLGNEISLPPGAYVTPTFRGATASGMESSTTSIEINQDTPLAASHWVYSDLNEANLIGSAKSLVFSLNMWSTNADTSPMISRTAAQAILSNNVINSPSRSDIDTAVDGEVIVNAAAGLVFAAATSTVTIPATINSSGLQIGSYISVSGTTSNNTVAGSEPMITDIDRNVDPVVVYLDVAPVNESPAATTITQYNSFIDEIAPTSGTAEAKYQIRQITLENPASAFQLTFAANIPTNASIQAYYRAGNTISGKKLPDSKWTAIPMTFKTAQSTEYIDQEYTVNGVSPYNTIQVKLVFISGNDAIVPKVKDLRVICLA